MVRTGNLMARIVNVVLGFWLLLSAVLWPHSHAQRTNTWVLGLLCMVFAITAMLAPAVRYLNTVLAVWLFISCWALPTVSLGTIWNNALVAIAIFIASLIPGHIPTRARG
ncbi:hypothetical protein BE20_40400 [Sorangium cellulosum]|uniref:SPW repeat-containing integral membrane domain-containing protein n=1 Tax=Sorangium cellulosum TaxID=56 RepID=A0A150RT78_SORCE|nr:hypothetical protein BE18_49610 [Sorangium cellulosum]KYF96941.1 hypothetical protein BE20_40400 [Sorangium cellulosum]